jgi:hypothetical protein
MIRRHFKMLVPREVMACTMEAMAFTMEAMTFSQIPRSELVVAQMY